MSHHTAPLQWPQRPRKRASPAGGFRDEWHCGDYRITHLRFTWIDSQGSTRQHAFVCWFRDRPIGETRALTIAKAFCKKHRSP